MSKELLRDCHITDNTCRAIGSSDLVLDDVPFWWPKREGTPVAGLYRCSHGDMREFSCDAQPAHLAKMCTSRIELFEHLVYYVANGSKRRIDSPFLHFTTDYWTALPYRDKTEYPDGRREVIVYLDLQKMFKAGWGSEMRVHDLSLFQNWDSYVQPQTMSEKLRKELRKAQIFSSKDSEVVLCWRGQVPLEFFDVHDVATRKKKSSLQNYMKEFFPHSFGSSTPHLPLRRSRSEMPRRPPPMPPPAGPPYPWRASSPPLRAVEWSPPWRKVRK